MIKRLSESSARLAVTAALLACLALTLAACGGGGDATAGGSDEGGSESGDPIKVGIIHPFSGSYASFANDIERGYELAIKDAGGEAGGREVELVEGDASTPEQAISEAKRLITQEDVDLLSGTYISSVASAASEIAARSEMVYWENHALANELTERGLDSFIRVAPKAETFAGTSADFISESLAESMGKSADQLNVFIEHEDSEYGTSVAENQAEALEAAGATVTENAHDAGATDLTDAVLRAKKAKPDVWLITGYVPDVNLLLRQADEQNFNPAARVLTGTGDSKETLDAVGAGPLSGTYVVQYSNPEIDTEFASGWQSFLKEFESTYGSEPLGGVAMVGYTGFTVLMEALQASEGDTSVEAVNEAAEAMDTPITGLPNGWGAKFNDENQNELVALVVGQWHQDGTLPTVYPEEAAVTEIDAAK